MPNSWKKNAGNISKKKKRGNSSKKKGRQYIPTKKYINSSSSSPNRRKYRSGRNRGKAPCIIIMN